MAALNYRAEQEIGLGTLVKYNVFVKFRNQYLLVEAKSQYSCKLAQGRLVKALFFWHGMIPWTYPYRDRCMGKPILMGCGISI
ncbi:MAG: hypothetical protein OXE41_09670 [Gammaproteobacteria bacterium]|nr:hypothetical protein [Gammaproteobacteria bacterium]MCY4217838.1 hypothetical protein [Gammaproteobacteria bacterium]MCY4275642.1 hypothetical protein [Gammaproteobacteria bacterium]